MAADDVGCVLLRTQDSVGDAALRLIIEKIRAAIEGRDIALLIEERPEAAPPSAVDGVHLLNAAGYAEARRRLGRDAAIGITCASRDEAVTVADAGADYVCFGDFDDPAPKADTLDLVAWWSPLITVPCVAAPGSTAEHRQSLADAGAEFVAMVIEAAQE